MQHSVYWKGTRQGTHVGFWLLKGPLKANLFLCRWFESEETSGMSWKWELLPGCLNLTLKVILDKKGGFVALCCLLSAIKLRNAPSAKPMLLEGWGGAVKFGAKADIEDRGEEEALIKEQTSLQKWSLSCFEKMKEGRDVSNANWDEAGMPKWQTREED